MKKTFIWAGLACLASTTAMAADSGVYFDLSAGQSSFKNVASKAALDAGVVAAYGGTIALSDWKDTGSSWSASVGYKFLPYFAAEAGYLDLGSTKYRAYLNSGLLTLYKQKVSASGPLLAAVGIVPIGKRFEVRGRTGVLFTKTAADAYGTDGTTVDTLSYSAKSSDLFVGIGGAFNATERVSIHLDWKRFKDIGDKYETGETDVDLISLGVTLSQ